MSYTGFYINLDRSSDRRAEMEDQLARHQLEKKYQRFPAIDGNILNFPNSKLKTGEMGCYTSHYCVLKENLDNDQPLHIMEDDVLFASCMEQTITYVVESGALDNYDLVYTDTSVPTSNNYYKTYKSLFDKIVKRNEGGRVVEAAFQLINMQDRFFGTTSSFLVNPKSIRKLHALYAAELARGPEVPIDIFIREQTERNVLKVGCVFPFVTSIRLEHVLKTTIEGRYDQMSSLALYLGRYSFFIDHDLDECRQWMQKLLPLPDDPHLQVLMHVLGFACTDRFVEL